MTTLMKPPEIQVGVARASEWPQKGGDIGALQECGVGGWNQKGPEFSDPLLDDDTFIAFS